MRKTTIKKNSGLTSNDIVCFLESEHSLKRSRIIDSLIFSFLDCAFKKGD